MERVRHAAGEQRHPSGHAHRVGAVRAHEVDRLGGERAQAGQRDLTVDGAALVEQSAVERVDHLVRVRVRARIGLGFRLGLGSGSGLGLGLVRVRIRVRVRVTVTVITHTNAILVN